MKESDFIYGTTIIVKYLKKVHGIELMEQELDEGLTKTILEEIEELEEKYGIQD